MVLHGRLCGRVGRRRISYIQNPLVINRAKGFGRLWTKTKVPNFFIELGDFLLLKIYEFIFDNEFISNELLAVPFKHRSEIKDR